MGAVILFIKLCQCACERQCNECDGCICKSYAVINNYNAQHDCCCFFCKSKAEFVRHICPIDLTSLIAVPVSDVKQLFEITINNNSYVIEPVNNQVNE